MLATKRLAGVTLEAVKHTIQGQISPEAQTGVSMALQKNDVLQKFKKRYVWLSSKSL